MHSFLFFLHVVLHPAAADLQCHMRTGKLTTVTELSGLPVAEVQNVDRQNRALTKPRTENGCAHPSYQAMPMPLH